MSNLVVQSDFSNDQLELIKSTVAKGATNDELKLFLYRCKNMGLDPLKPGQVHFVKYGNNPGSMIVGIDGIRAKASRTGKLAGIKRGVTKDENGKCIGGWCEVYRSDWQHPAREEVPMSEYNTGKAQWQSKPETMIKKVAEVAALRMAFPDDLGGMYAEEEVQRDQVRDARAKELTTSVQETTAAPEYEAAEYFDAPAEAVEPGLGDFVFTVGKKHKGKKLKDISYDELEAFIQYVDEQDEATVHVDVMSCKNAVVEYVLSLNEKKEQG